MPRPRGADQWVLVVFVATAVVMWLAFRPQVRAPRPLPPATPMISRRDFDAAAGTPWPALATSAAGGPIRWPEAALAHAVADSGRTDPPRAAVVRLVNNGLVDALCGGIASTEPVTKSVWVVGLTAEGMTMKDVLGIWYDRQQAAATSSGSPVDPAPLSATPAAVSLPSPSPLPIPVAGKYIVIFADDGFTSSAGPIYADGERDPATGRMRCPTLATLRALESFPYGADGCAIDSSWFAGAGAEPQATATGAGHG